MEMSDKHIRHAETALAQRLAERVRAIALPLALAIAWGTAMLVSAAHAEDHAWCSMTDSELRCDYPTRQQCMAAGSGLSASCMQNPRIPAEPPHAAYAKYNKYK